MAKKKTDIISQKRWAGGIADYPKENAAGQIPDSYFYSRAIDYRSDPQALTLLPAAVKESGSVVTDLVKWSDIVPTTLATYHYGNMGNIYARSSAGSWSNLRTVANAHGNGLGYFIGDDYLYYSTDSAIGRYGPLTNSPQFSDNFLQAQGGVPQNTASLLLASASSMYATAADSATLSVTGDLTLETYFKANSLPAVGSSMTFFGKWDESGVLRSYKLDLFGVSGNFGNAGDGNLTISVNTTDSPIDSAAAATSGTQTISATNGSFAAGQQILLWQTVGTNAGQKEILYIQSYVSGTITTTTPIQNTYTAGAQVIVRKQYNNVTVNNGATWKPKAWNGTVGGLLTFCYQGTFTNNGTIQLDARGYRGGITQNTPPGISQQGEGYPGLGTFSSSPNGNGGGSGQEELPTGPPQVWGGGGGGELGGGATAGTSHNGGTLGQPGNIAGSNDLTTFILGGGGAVGSEATPGGNGGAGLYVSGPTFVNNGTITSNGGVGTAAAFGSTGSGGGSGGPMRFEAQTWTNNGTIQGIGGIGGTSGYGTPGGNGGRGRLVVDYLTSYSQAGTITGPSLVAIQDNTLTTNPQTQARLGISNDGTSFEHLTFTIPNLTTGVWNRLSVSWKATTSLASFYLNAVNLGTFTGTKTAIHDNASLLYVGANKGASVIQNFFDGELNDMRIWGNVQTAAQIFANNQVQVSGSSPGLEAYYKFNSVYTDASPNGNTLTPHASPTFVSDVPFSAPTTRQDIDTQNTNIGSTYIIPASIIEDAVDTLNFTPLNDPQKSVGFYIDTKGTGDYTLTIHDQQNRVIATQTITNANIPAAGFIEFVFSTPWRTLAGKSYHMHLTVSTGTSKIVSGSPNDFSTAEYASYYSYLVTDTQFHPIIQFQYQPLGGSLTGAVIIGNERYLAVWDGANYLPNFVTFSPGWKVRCFGFWRNYLAIGVWKGGNIYDFNQGRIYFWTGYQPAFDFYIDVPEGQINAMFGVDSDLYIHAGFRGQLLNYQGGFFYESGNTAAGKLKRMPFLSDSDYTEVYPGALTMWRGLLYMGLYANSSSATAQRGVYSFGTYNPYYPQSLSYDYVISTGNNGTSVSIGNTYPVGQKMLISWQDGAAYGVDVVDFQNNPPAASGEIQTLIMDGDEIWKQKSNSMLRGDFLPLRTGESVAIEYNQDRIGWTTPTTDSTVDDNFTKAPLSSGRAREIQIGAKLFATNGTSPTFLGISLQPDQTESEEQF